MTTYGTKLTVKMQSIPYTITAGVDYFLRFSDGEEIRAAFVKPDGRNINIMSNSSRLNGGNSIEAGLMRELSGRFSQNYYITVDSDKTTGLMPGYIVEIREVDGPADLPSTPKIPRTLTLKLNGGRAFEAEFDKIYQVKTSGSQWWNGVIVIQDHKILMLSNNVSWNGGHKLSEKNAAYGFKFQWYFGSVHNLVPGKEFHYTDMYDIAEVEATEPTPEEILKVSYGEYRKMKEEELEEVNEATEEPCCASTTRRKAKLVFKKIR